MKEKYAYIPVRTIKEFRRTFFVGIGVPERTRKSALMCSSRPTARHRFPRIGRLKMYYDRIRKGIQSPLTNLTVMKEPRPRSP